MGRGVTRAAGASDELLSIAASVVDRAGPGEQVDVMVSRGSSTSIRVFEGEVEAFTSARTAGVGVRVIVDGRVGFAHAGSLAPDVVADVLAEARDNVPFAEADEWAGLAEPDGAQPISHYQWNPAVLELSAEERIARAV